MYQPSFMHCLGKRYYAHVQPTAGNPAFFDFLPGFFHNTGSAGHHMHPFQGGMLEIPHHSEIGHAAGLMQGEESGCNHNGDPHDGEALESIKAEQCDGATTSRPLHKDSSLTMQDAAEVLYGIGRADGDPGESLGR